MNVELIQCLTDDGIGLDGALASPAAPTKTGAIVLHGIGGNFYGSTMLKSLAGLLIERGYATILANTRGHDHVANYRSRRIGAAVEAVKSCVSDLRAWRDFLRTRGVEKVILVGHSLGAIKSIYFARERPEHISGVVAISPALLSYERFVAKNDPAFHESIGTAMSLVERGFPETFFEAKFPFPMVFTAGAYVDKYGPAEEYNYLRLMEEVATPTAFIFGGEEMKLPTPAFFGLDREVAELKKQRNWSHVALETVTGADHSYQEQRKELLAATSRALDFLQSTTSK
jgi:pimeloyl-ACP methyl ester carboxylesterase